MLLTPEQTNSLLEIINRNQSILIGKQLGLDFLSEYDRALLESSGVNWQELYNPVSDSIYQSFHLGMLSTSLNDAKALNLLTYKQLEEYIKHGKYIPVTSRETAVINAIKSQTLADIKVMSGRIFQDVHGEMVNMTLEGQRSFIKEEITEGIKNQETIRKISNRIHSKTGDWSRNFDRIVEYQANTAYQEGRAAIMQRDGNTKVYKRVFQSACKHCIKLYLTGGFGSEPILFNLEDLRNNGTNIGRKVDEWRPVIGSTHPHCRCLLMYYRAGFAWNPKTQAFDLPDKTKGEMKGSNRPKVKVWIGGKEMLL